MSREDAIKVEGTVVEVFPNTTCRVELSNGHRVLAHLSSPLRRGADRAGLGERVALEISPFDLSRGCIVKLKNNL